MPNEKNQAQVSQLQTTLKETKSVVIADYSGLNVAAQTELRAKLSEAGGKLVVTKNRLFKVAVADQVGDGMDTLAPELEGQNAFLFSLEDAVAPIKAMFDFAADNEQLTIKVGILDGKVLSFEETKALSKLPSKAELISQLISRIQGPSYGLVNVLSAPTRNLVYALSAISEKSQ